MFNQNRYYEMKKHKTVNAAQEFLTQFAILRMASVGVILCRTREPARMEETLRVWAFSNNVPEYRGWNRLRGWVQYNENPLKNGKPDNQQSILPALMAITDFNGGGKNPWADGIFVVQYPHWELSAQNPYPDLIQLIKQYCQDFPESGKQLVLVAPEGTSLPIELQNDVVTLDFGLPLGEELSELLDATLHEIDSEGKFDFSKKERQTMVNSGGGMTYLEFETALAQALVKGSREGDFSADTANRYILEAKTEVIKRSEVLELMEPVSMDEVGGLDVLKDWVTLRLCAYTEEAKEYGVDAPKGIATIGVPGGGKSLISKAIASLMGLPLIRFDIRKVFGGIVGQTESRTEAALKQIDAMAPCIVFVDEIDKAGIDPRQSGGDSGVSSRVIQALLTHMQESPQDVFWVMSANRADNLPPELIRKGRLDEVFAVLAPNQREREAIIRIHLAKRKKALSEEDVTQIAHACAGYVGAELEAAIKAANTESFSRKTEFTAQAVIRELRDMKPLSEAYKEDFDAMTQWAENNARLASYTGQAFEAPRTPRRRRTNLENN